MLYSAHTVYSLSPCPRRKTYHTFKHLLTHVAEADSKLLLGAFFSLLRQHLLKDATQGPRKEEEQSHLQHLPRPCRPSSLWRPSAASRLHLGLQTRGEKGKGKRRRAALRAGQSREAELRLLRLAKHSSC